MSLPVFPADATTLLLPGPAGMLEVVVEHPAADAPVRALTVIVCHPLPTAGGSLHNKVVTMTARSLRELGATAVRFNFRGSGQSEGQFDHGVGECDDLRAVFEWVRVQRPEDTLWLAGFSFGAYVSLVMNAELHPDLLLSIAPPVGRWNFSAIPAPSMPWLVIQGDDDEIVSPAAVSAWLNAIVAPVRLLRLADAGHFFHRKMMDLRATIQCGVDEFLPAPVRIDD